MKVIRTILVCLFLIVGAAGVSAMPVSAGQSSQTTFTPAMLKGIYEKLVQSGNPNEAFTELPMQSQQALIKALSNISTQVTLLPKPLDISAWDQTVEVDGYFPWSTLAWKFDEEICWWGDGTYVTNIVSNHAYSSYTAWPYAYDGLDSEHENGGVGYTYFTMFSQGKFVWWVLPWELETDSPWISLTVGGNGSVNASGGQG